MDWKLANMTHAELLERAEKEQAERRDLHASYRATETKMVQAYGELERQHDALRAALEMLCAEVEAHLDYEDDKDMEAALEGAQAAIAQAKGE
jgi:tRNA U34 5-carboxymethylaminomethyl modifying GTPase MnmE/TrmE